VALCALAALGPAAAAEPDKSVTVDGLRLGDTLTGPAVSPGDLKGRVVFVEFWGVN
jgi:hypothetical protein